MHFFSLPSLLVGLAVSSVVQAVPSTYGRRTDLMPRGLPDSAYKLRYMPRAAAGSGKKGGKGNNNDVEVDITVVDVTEKIDINKQEIDLEVKVTQILIKNKGNNKKKDDKRKDDAKKNNKDKVS
jgi:hypothetical protein